jgi:hypothetical protein
VQQRKHNSITSFGASEQGWRKCEALYFRGIAINYQLVLVFGACTGTSAGF